MATMTNSAAAEMVITQEMARDPTIFIYGQGNPQGHRALAEKYASSAPFNSLRVNITPISESAMTGAAIGAALNGARPICEHALSDFINVAHEQFVNEAGRIRFKLGNKVPCPAVISIGYGLKGIGLAVQHSNAYYNKFAGVPGLIVAIPSQPADLVGLWRTALRGINPVTIWQSLLIGGNSGDVPDGDYTIPFGQGKVQRQGTDVTIAGVGWTLWMALTAADTLAKQGISAEVWDPRTLTPFDRAGLLASVKKTGALVVADEEPMSFGTTGEFAMTVAEAMDPVPPMARVTLMDASCAYNPVLEAYVMPTADKIVKAAQAVIARKSKK